MPGKHEDLTYACCLLLAVGFTDSGWGDGAAAEGGEGDKAAAAGHAFGKGREQAHREVHAAEACQDAREPHAEVAHPGDADARGVHRFGNLAGGPQPEAKGRAVDDEPGYGDEDIHQVDEDALIEESLTYYGDVGEERDRDRLEAVHAGRGAPRAEDHDHQETRAAESQKVDGSTGDDLIRLEGNAHQGVDQGEEKTGSERCEEAD